MNTTIKKNINYEDVTAKWLKKAKPNNGKLIIDKIFIDDNGIRHPIKGKEIAHEPPIRGEEYNKALWLISKFGGTVHLVPRITDISNTGLKVKTPDYLWNKEKWDLKTPKKGGHKVIERFVKNPNSKLQAKNFIIDIENIKESDLTIIKLAQKTLNNPCRQWIKTLIIARGTKIIKIYSRKKN